MWRSGHACSTAMSLEFLILTAIKPIMLLVQSQPKELQGNVLFTCFCLIVGYRMFHFVSSVVFDEPIHDKTFYKNHLEQALIGGIVHSCIQILLEIFLDLDNLVHFTILLLSNLIYVGFYVRHTMCIHNYCFFDITYYYFLISLLPIAGLAFFMRNQKWEFPPYILFLIFMITLCLVDWTMMKLGWLRVDITVNGLKKVNMETLPTVCDKVEQSNEMSYETKAGPVGTVFNLNHWVKSY
ncbi:hypothetical protein B9Z55_027749 [Caenorhabditis nigoni]|uniref:Uncharacterized protein n=3 Tax=Caenorhabditis nigoni TaxID=1611254 RepID=A0A2G5SEP9_9PELO|nr:hypothetical protein B9Z55_027749 [Caenorhabditis nigoni]